MRKETKPFCRFIRKKSFPPPFQRAHGNVILPADTIKAGFIKKILLKQGNYILKEISFIGNTKIRMQGNGPAACGTKITVYIKGTIQLSIAGDKLYTLIPPMPVKTLFASAKWTN
ncbi:hypothetical protein DRN98_07205 [Methanosarcinales archaeon]|nr:MAG: hypothetical protein DRN98_07205 [Methanosarcinales archaeon]